MKRTNETTLTDLANQMAIRFEETITASKLSEWVGFMNDQLQDYVMEMNEGDIAISFLNAINYALLPGLIDCKNDVERLTFLRERLPLFLSLDDSKVALCEIGKSLMHHFRKFTIDIEESGDWMDILKAFIHIADIYSYYRIRQMESLEAA